MKTEVVKCNIVLNGVKHFVGQADLKIAESLEDIIQMNEDGEFTEKNLVTLFNASRRIELQRKIKAGESDSKPTAKAMVADLKVAANKNAELAKLLREAGFSI